MSQPFAPPPPPGEWGQPWDQGVPPGPPPSNGVAIASMVIGLLALLPAITIVLAFLAVFPGVLAIILGAIGLSTAKRHPLRPGRGMAITGIVCGALTVIALVIEIVVLVVAVDSVDVDLVDQQPAEVDDYEISERTCGVVDGRAAASGVLTNRSGAPHAFILDVRFQDGSRPLATREDRIESPLADGAAWSWQVVLPLEEGSGVDTDGLQCRIVQVELATVDPGD